jgi:GNAT superfamily N-acetyltransferase
MIYELEPSDLSKVAHIFRGHKQYVPVFAVIEGNFPGRIFVDDKDSPNTALVWAISRWAYIDGDALNRPFVDFLAALVRDVIIPDSRRIRMNWFELYAADSPVWAAAIERSLGEYKPDKHYEIVYTLDKQKYLKLRKDPKLPEGMRIEKVELPILPNTALDAPFVRAEFEARTSFGFQLKRDNKVISVCCSNGLISGKEFMVDVQTFDKDERSKGYGTATGIALLDFCLEKGYDPLWETTLDNIPSQKLARRLGFVESESYPVYAIEF